MNYTHDPEDRLLSVMKNGALHSQFWYDTDGRRVRIDDTADGLLTHVYSGLNIVYENGSSGWTRHIYASGLHVAENRSDAVEYFHHDHLGSTRLKTNTSGEAVYEANYVSFSSA